MENDILTFILAVLAPLAALLGHRQGAKSAIEIQERQHKQEELTRFDELKRELYSKYLMSSLRIAVESEPSGTPNGGNLKDFANSYNTLCLIAPNTLQDRISKLQMAVNKILDFSRPTVANPSSYDDLYQTLLNEHTKCIDAFRKDLRIQGSWWQLDPTAQN